MSKAIDKFPPLPEAAVGCFSQLVDFRLRRPFRARTRRLVCELGGSSRPLKGHSGRVHRYGREAYPHFTSPGSRLRLGEVDDLENSSGPSDSVRPIRLHALSPLVFCCQYRSAHYSGAVVDADQPLRYSCVLAGFGLLLPLDHSNRVRDPSQQGSKQPRHRCGAHSLRELRLGLTGSPWSSWATR